MIHLLGIAFAAAEDIPAGQGSQTLGNYLFPIMLILTVAVFYFLMIRPQKKKEKERQDMVNSLKKGDRVMTTSGMYGVIDSFKEGDIVVLKISGNTKVEFTKSAIHTKVS